MQNNNIWDKFAKETSPVAETKKSFVMRHISRNMHKLLSVVLATVFSILLFSFGFLVSSFDDNVPVLVDKSINAVSSDLEEEKEPEEKPIETDLAEKPETPQMEITQEQVELNTPKLEVDYVVNTNISIGMQVPAPPVFKAQAVTSLSGPISVSQLDDKPSVVYNPRPKYPKDALNIQKETVLQVQLLINAKGEVSSVKVLPSPHKELFEKETIIALKRWRFKPGRLNGKNVSTIVQIPIRFEIY